MQTKFFMKGCDNKKMEEMIRLQGITKKYGNNLIIPKLDLTIYDGEFLTLLGPSGCGKTTLLRMIAGLDTPTTGKVFLDDEDVTNKPPYKRDVNMVFQHYALFPHMTVEENIKFGLMMKKVPAEEQKERVAQVLYLTQLEEFRNRRPQQMSGGQQQRVAIARALVNNPKVLLLDEPLGALDYQLRKNLQLELKNLQRGLGLTFIYVTHDQEEALTMSDRRTTTRIRFTIIPTPALSPNLSAKATFLKRKAKRLLSARKSSTSARNTKTNRRKSSTRNPVITEPL